MVRWLDETKILRERVKPAKDRDCGIVIRNIKMYDSTITYEACNMLQERPWLEKMLQDL